jgi:hypothetical protein
MKQNEIAPFLGEKVSRIGRRIRGINSLILRMDISKSSASLSFIADVLKLWKRIYMGKKIDGVIEAVRFKNGQISAVRAYERRGATFSDWLLLDRKTLLERLEKGQRFAIGSRKELLAGTFKIEKPVMLVKSNQGEFIATRETAERDELEDTPFF